MSATRSSSFANKPCQSSGGELTLPRVLNLAYSADCCYVVQESELQQAPPNLGRPPRKPPYRKTGQSEWTAPAILFACLVFTLTAPLYIWDIVGV